MHPVKWFVCTLLVAASLLMPSAASAQTADIVGRVMDNSGGVLPGATVTVENVATRDVRTAVTSDTGDYVFTFLPIGTYTVKIELQGFSAYSSRAVLTSGDRTRIDGRLNVGVVTETVEVTAEAPLLQTDASTLRTLVTEKAVQDLPIVGRNFINVVSMVPGATPTSGERGGNVDDRRQTASVSINGGAGGENNHQIDGMDNNERFIGTIGVKPSMDAVQEIRVQTNLYSAESGRTGGGVIGLITKSGTNEFHGSAYEYYRNARFDERDYFANRAPVNNQHQFGATLGGPIVRNRTFFFSDYERVNATTGQVNNITLPTLKMRMGDFSEISGQIFDPFTSPRVAFPGNQIPANRISPIALRYLALLPAPTTSGLANNYQSTTTFTERTNTADVRLDHRINASNTIWGRWSYNGLNTVTPSACPVDSATGINPGCTEGTNNGHVGPNKTRAASYQANYVRVFSPTLVGEFKGGLLDLSIGSYAANDAAGKSNLSAAFGIPGVNVDDIATGLSLMNMTGFAVLGDTQNLPLVNKNFTKQFSAVLTKTAGAHGFKIGGGVIMREVSNTQSSSPNGIFAFNANLTRSATGAGGHSVASFLLGVPTTITRNHAPFTPYYHSSEPSAFIQDDWRATHWLTINLGLRYDVSTPFTEENDMISNLDPFEPRLYVAGRDGASRTAGVKTDYSNVQPRFGFAATLPQSMVIRGGYGLSFIPNNRTSFATMKNFPLAVAYAPTSLGNGLGGIPDLLLGNGLPPIDLPSTTPAPRELTGSFRAIDIDAKSTRYQQFNVQLEKEFAGNVATVGYVGSLGDFLPGGNNRNLNMAPVGPGQLQPRRIFNATLPDLTTINYFTTQYESSYHALQLVFQRRFREGLAVTTHYTRSVSKNSGPLPWAIIDPVTRKFTDDTREWSYVADRPHKWVGQVNYALPWGRALGGVAGALVAGWQVNVSTFWMSGSPWGVTNSTDVANVGPTNGNDRPNLVGDPILPKSERTLDRWFNTAAFEAQPLFTVGNAPPTVGWGPSQRRIDLSLFKDITLSGNNRLQLRYEVYNLTNTVNFANPNTTLGNANFGRISSTSGIPRQMQFAAKVLF